MKNHKRKKLVRASLESLLQKYERRIQRLSEEAYQIRQTLEQFDATNAKVNVNIKEEIASVTAGEQK